MNLTGFSLRYPYAVMALLLVVAALGSVAFFNTPTDLFPDTVPPQVVVVTVQPGATARDISDKITQIIEKELSTIGGLKKVTSTSRDEVSSVNAEFFYHKPINDAVLDVQSALARIRPELPGDIREPRIYKITDATRPLLTVALSPKPGCPITLEEIRLVAENQIEDEILTLPGIADVDLFGAHRPEIQVRVDRDRLRANHLPVEELISVLAKQNISIPAGTLYSGRHEYLIKTSGEFENLEQIKNLVLRRTAQAELRLSDVADVSVQAQEPRSMYHGNGKAAIALNILRPDQGPTVSAIQTFKNHLPVLQNTYPDIQFEITDDQEPIIDLNVKGMRGSLVQAIILTVLIIFLFLADIRAAVVVSLSIPLSFLFSLMILRLSPYTMNMVTLSGMIIAVGMVVDASIVVLENIYRHFNEMEHPDARAAALAGTKEIALAITAGMFTTVIVLIPVMFSGGYTQQTMRPLNLMISSTLIGSLLVALTVIPLLASRVIKGNQNRRNWLERMAGLSEYFVRGVTALYTGILRLALRTRLLTVGLAVFFWIVTIRLVPPLIGGELMPLMDTGIVNLEFETPPQYSPPEVEEVLYQIENLIYQNKHVLSVSSVIGSEPGEISFGGGGATAQSGKLVIHLIDRTQRKETIWEIQDQWRQSISHIPGVKSFRINEYGATPLSTTRAPLDIIISGPDRRILDHLADECLTKLKGIPGLVDVRRSWYLDKPEFTIQVDPTLARLYQTSPQEIALELKTMLKGISPTAMRLNDYLDIPITVQYAGRFLQQPGQLSQTYVTTNEGLLPLRALATDQASYDQPFITRERLQHTIDITGVNRVYTIAQVGKMVQTRLANWPLPAGYSIEVAGTITDMKLGNEEMGKALKIGFILLYLLLVAMFQSFRHPLTIMSAIPLAVAGGLWGLLLFDKPLCKPATMGLILLGGTIVNNSILLLDFIIRAREKGMNRNEAILNSVRLRIRPILMTTVSTIVGLTPLVFEMAVGLERMSPLGIVAFMGLLIGTFLTIIVVPVIYALLDSAAVAGASVISFLRFKHREMENKSS